MKLNKTILLLGLILLLLGACATGKLDSREVKSIKANKTIDEQYMRSLEFYENKRYDKALSLFTNIEQAYRGHQRIDTIMFYSANCYFFNGDYLTSSEMYNAYRVTMGRGSFSELADLYYALSLYHVSPDVELDQTYTVLAIAAFRDFIHRNAGHDMIPQCDKYIAELQLRLYNKDMDIALTYYNIGHYNSCLQVLSNILQKDPNTPFREDLLFLIVKANYEYARMSIKEKRLERFYDAIDGFYRFAEEFPNSEFMKAATRFHKHASGYADGTSVVNEITGRVISKKNELYERKKELDADIIKFRKRGKKEKLASAIAEKVAIEGAIVKFNNLVEKRDIEVEFNRK